MLSVRSPLPATVVSIDVVVGQVVRVGQPLIVLESMKMEHVIVAESAAVVQAVAVALGDTIAADQLLVELRMSDSVMATEPIEAAVEDGEKAIRADLAEVIARHEIGLDSARPQAVAKRTAKGQRTARENILDLLDPDSFVEYAPLVTAAQRRRRSVEELRSQTPADGLVGGIGTIAGRRVVAMSYDYMVLAGTQGLWNHYKKDRLFELAERAELPVVLFAEGGGGRPGDTDGMGVSGLDCLAFNYFARLSGVVPLVGIAAGYCFAGNAALLGCCDVVIATKDSNIGMGGPAMIEGGGLGTYEPKQIGPASEQVRSGVIDVLVDDEQAAVAVAKKYLAYFSVDEDDFTTVDQATLRDVVPESRTRAYDVHSVVDALFDTGSVIELRKDFAPNMVTALARIEGKAIGVIANNPLHLGGAIDSDAADKAARFMQLSDAFGLPIISLCDTPGFMVGPESEATGAVRHMSRLFVTGANLTVPTGTIVLRKGYGLGAQAMAAGSFKAPLFTVAWPTGEFGGMNLQGAVRLGMKRELDAITDEAERTAAFDQMVERMYEVGKAVNVATHFEIDDVIDPAESRRWIQMLLLNKPTMSESHGSRRRFIDTW